MAVGFGGQVIMVFPDLDILAVTAARAHLPLSKLADYIFSAVKSDKAVPPDAASAKLVADEISDASTEKPREVGPTSKLAGSISGKVYRFAPNELNLKSISLVLTDPHSHYEGGGLRQRHN